MITDLARDRATHGSVRAEPGRDNRTPARPSPRTWLPEMAAEAGLPYATYLVLSGVGVCTAVSLAVGAVWPATFIAVRFGRHRRLDRFGIIVLGLIAVGVGLSLVSGNARFALVKESFFTGGFGLAMLASLLARRPLMFYFGRKFATDGSPAGQAAWESFWPKSPTFRRSTRVMTVVWGVVFLAEAGVRVGAAYTLPITTVAGLSAVVPLVVVGLLMAWTFFYGARTRPRSRAEVQTADAAAAQ